MENKEIIGDGIKKIRQELGYQQWKFAAELGLSGGYLSEIEAGKKNPGIDILEKLYLKFNVNVTYLFSGKGDYFVSPQKKNNRAKYPESPASGTVTERDVGAELNWCMDHIPAVRFAVLEFFKSYSFQKRDMIRDEIDRLVQDKPENTST